MIKKRGFFPQTLPKLNYQVGEKLYLAGSGMQHYFAAFKKCYDGVVGNFGSNRSMQQFLVPAFQTIQMERVRAHNLDYLYGGYMDCVEMRRDDNEDLVYKNLSDACFVHYYGKIDEDFFVEFEMHKVLLFHAYVEDTLVIVRVDTDFPGRSFCAATIFPVHEIDREHNEFDYDSFFLQTIQPKIHVVSVEAIVGKDPIMLTVATGELDVIKWGAKF